MTNREKQSLQEFKGYHTICTNLNKPKKKYQYFNMGNQPNLFDNESIKTRVTNVNYLFNSNVYPDCIGIFEFNSQD